MELAIAIGAFAIAVYAVIEARKVKDPADIKPLEQQLQELDNRLKIAVSDLEHRKSDVERLERRQYELMERIRVLEEGT